MRFREAGCLVLPRRSTVSGTTLWRHDSSRAIMSRSGLIALMVAI
jgi:hypothetical protein